MNTHNSIQELVNQTQSYYRAGQYELAAKMLRQALEQGANVDIDLLQNLAEYIYGHHLDPKVYKFTLQELMGSDIEPIRRKFWEHVRDLKCSDHGNRPYILSKEFYLFIVCCCTSLEKQVRSIVFKDNSELVEKLFYNGWDSQQVEKFDQAIIKYEEVLKIGSEKKEIPMLACINIGNIYYNRNDFGAAIQYYKEAVEINPSHDWPYYNLANVYRDIGEFEKAVNEYKKAIEINPHDAGYHKNLGLVYGEIGEFKLAAQEIQKCVEISHGTDYDPLNYYNIGLFHYKMQNYIDAENWFIRFLNAAPVQHHQYMTNAERIIEEIKKIRRK